MSLLLMISVLLLKITIGISDFILISGVVVSAILRLISMPIITGLNHKGTIVLETERLILRLFKEEDWVEMYNGWATDTDVTRYVTWKPHESIEETKKLIKDGRKQRCRKVSLDYRT